VEQIFRETTLRDLLPKPFGGTVAIHTGKTLKSKEKKYARTGA
jgi:hypothetical protein